jgi:hypothetical protein
MEKYGGHTHCAVLMEPHRDSVACDCGYDETIAALAEDSK